MASRTDRGVSARGNALALSSELSATSLLHALNSIAPEICFTHAARVLETFRPRSASGRWYRYLVPAERKDLSVWTRAATFFRGTIDVRSFGVGVPSDRPSFRPIGSVGVTEDPPWLVVDVRAASFVRGMVRKIVAALAEVDRGHLTIGALRDALAGTRRLMLPLAEPEPLVLWDVSYPQPWETSWRGPNRRQREFYARVWRLGHTQTALAGALWGPEPAHLDSHDVPAGPEQGGLVS